MSLSILLFVLFISAVHCDEKPAVVKIGAVFAFESVIGKAAKAALEMAVNDVNKNPRILNGTELKLVMEDSSCSVFMGSIKAFQVIENEVMVIIGPQSSSLAHIISHIAHGLHLPLISFAATDPTLSSLQFPYFLRTSHTDSDQMAAVADIVDYFGYKDVVAIFIDNDYGRNGIGSLDDELVKRMSKLSYKLPLSPRYNSSEIADVLKKSNALGPRVYVVHIDSDPNLKFFTIVKNLDMMNGNYVWLATDWLSTTLDSLPRDMDDYLKILQGVITLRPHIPNKKAYISRLREIERKAGLNAYALYAYDALWLVAQSIDLFLKEKGSVRFSLTDESGLKIFKVFDGGDVLLDIMSHSNFTGLTGEIRFGSDRNLMNSGYEIVNVVKEEARVVGYWSNPTGLSVQSPEDIKRRNIGASFQDEKLNNITWPGGEVEKPRGWVIATNEKPLRIGFPKRVSFTEFVAEQNHSHKVQGYCIDLFDEVLKLVPYEVPYVYTSFGDGINNPSYDELARMVAHDVFDAAVGDIAIVTNRTKIVDFTLPFDATGLVIVAPIGNSSSNAWVFLKPFTPELWCLTAFSFVLIAFVIWLLEHRVNDDFRGPPSRQLKTMFLFSFSTLFKANREKTKSTLGRIVMVVWLFVLLVISSSYTASLTSILTVQQLSTPIKGIDSLISSELPIGYQVGSFAYGYMTDSLYIHKSRLVSLGSPEEYERALRRGPSNGGVAAIVDETPYIEFFLSKHSDFGIVGQPFTRSGWGFALKKGSPLAIDMSTAILKLAESGELEKIHKKWFCKSGCPDELRTKSDTDQLQLSSFWALYSICGLFGIVSSFVFLIRSVRQYIRYRSQHMTDDPASAPPNNVFVARAIRNFIDFIDEKEEAVKRIFTHQSDKSQNQVCEVNEL